MRELLDLARLGQDVAVAAEDRQLELLAAAHLHAPARRARRAQDVLGQPEVQVALLVALTQHHLVQEGAGHGRGHGLGPLRGGGHVHAHGAAVHQQAGEDVQEVLAVGAALAGLAPCPDAVDQQEDARLLRAVADLPVLGERARAGRRVALGALVDDPREPGQEPLDALDVVGVDDGPHVRQGLEHAQGAAAGVDGVDVHRAGLGRDRGGDGQRAQGGGLARAGGAVEDDIALVVGVEVLGVLVLVVRVVDDPQDDVGVALLGEVVEVVAGRELGQPRLARLLDAGELGRPGHGVDDAVDVLPDIARVDLAARDLPGAGQPEGHLLHRHLRGGGLRRGARPGVGGLELGDAPGTGLGGGAAGDLRREVGGGLLAQDVLGVGLVGHAQGHAQVRVGAQVVLDDARRALGGQDEVQAQGAPALGDVDDAVDELGDLADQGGELVDDDDQARRALRVALLLQGDQVLGALVVEQVLAVAQLGPQRGQRPAHHGRGQVGDDPHRMRQIRAPGEGRPALVVDEEEGDAVGRQRLGHAQDPGLEELGLAGARGPAHQGVRAVDPQVQGQGPLRPLADQGRQAHRPLEGGDGGPVDDRVARPPPHDLGVGVVGELGPGQPDVGDGAGQVGLVVDRDAGVDDGGQEPPQARGALGVESLDDDDVTGHRAAHEPDAAGALADLDESAAGRGQGLDVVGDPDDVHAHVRPLLDDAGQPGPVRPGAVDEDDDGRHRGLVALVVALVLGRAPQPRRPVAAPLGDELLQAGDQQGPGAGVAGQLHGADGRVRGGGVRDPLQPGPPVAPAPVGQAHQRQLGRRVQRDELGDQGPRHAVEPVAAPRHPQGAVLAQIGHDRHRDDPVVDGPDLLDHLLVDRQGGGVIHALHLGARHLRADAQAQLEELGVLGAARPQARAQGLGVGQDLLGGGVLGEPGHALAGVRGLDVRARLGERGHEDPGGVLEHPAPADALVDPGADHDQGAQGHEDDAHDVPRHEVHERAHDQRGDQGQEREAGLLLLLGGGGQGHLDLGRAGHDPRGADMADVGGVGHAGHLGDPHQARDPQRGIAHRHHVGGGDGLLGHPLVADEQAVGGVEVGDLDLGAHRQAQVVLGDQGVARQADPALGGAPDLGGPQRDGVALPGVGPAQHEDDGAVLGVVLPRRRHGAHPHHRPRAQTGLVQVQVRVEQAARAAPQRGARAPGGAERAAGGEHLQGPGAGVDRLGGAHGPGAGQARGDVADRGGGVRGDPQVLRHPVGGGDGQAQFHGRSSGARVEGAGPAAAAPSSRGRSSAVTRRAASA